MNSTLYFSTLPYFSDISSIISIFITAIGFFATITTAVRAKKSADAARAASENTRSKISSINNIIECTTAISSLEEAFRHSRMGAYVLIPDRLLQAKKSIILVKESSNSITDKQSIELQSILSHISTCLRIFETINSEKDSNKNILKFNNKMQELIERIMHISAEMRNS